MKTISASRELPSIFKASYQKLKLELTYDGWNLWEMDYDPQKNDYFPPWAEIEESGYSDVIITDGKNHFDFHDFR